MAAGGHAVVIDVTEGVGYAFVSDTRAQRRGGDVLGFRVIAQVQIGAYAHLLQYEGVVGRDIGGVEVYEALQ
jgi:thymidine phosphorylase